MKKGYEREFEIHSVSDYLEAIHIINDPRLGEFYYRGQSNEEYKLIPSISRKVSKESEQTFLHLEKDLIAETLFKYSDVFCNYTSNIELLTQLQHYGIPTRLMDVTVNPLVALFFACNSNKDKQGEVIVFHMNPACFDYYDYEAINALASIGFNNHEYPIDFYGFLKESGVELKTSVNMHTSNYDHLQLLATVPILIRQKTFFERQKAQAGRYLLFINHIEYGEHFTMNGFSKEKSAFFEEKIDPIDKASNQSITNIIKIPGDCKNGICSQLKTLNIDESTLFPEDIDRGCKMLVKDICYQHQNSIIMI